MIAISHKKPKKQKLKKRLKMSNIFTTSQFSKVGTNTFDLSHERKFDAKIGELTPILVQEVIPGDTFTIKSSSLIRLAPMVTPVMHRISAYTHYFFVPNRIIWDGWEDFITGNDERTMPYLNRKWADDRLPDFLGVPNSDSRSDVQLLPFAAYNRIYNDFYRDENLIEPIRDSLSDGANASDDFLDLRKRAWQHDYFTSALPWTQKGPEVTMPMGGTAPLILDGVIASNIQDTDGARLQNYDDNLSTDPFGKFWTAGQSFSNQLQMDVTPHTLADLSQATATSIISLRRAFKLQEFLEKNARGGTRYIEHIMVHFGVRSSDGRLQRAEYIGGNITPVQISEVLQTSQTTNGIEPGSGSPQANMAGHGISADSTKKQYYKAEEHGYIIGIQSVMPVSTYQQGFPKHLIKFDRFDYFYPSFQHIGEQPIYNIEVYSAEDGKDSETFGYTPRYAEYKYTPSTVHGQYRTTLNFWHAGRIFNTRPQLNQDFIECDYTEFDRIFAVANQEQLYCHVYNDIKANRKMAYFGNPKM